MEPTTNFVPRVVFMGTAELACASLSALASSPDCRLVAVVSQPDRPKGRELRMQPTAVKATALGLGLPVLQPLKARDPLFLEQLRGFAPDLIVVAAYGQILPKSILEMGRLGCINVHTSILPKYRGAAPIQWAIANGDPETGVTIMKMDEGLDTGPILQIERTPILPEDNGQTLHDRLAVLGASLLLRTLPGVIDGSIVPVVQPADGASYARKITKEDGRIDWSRSPIEVWNRARGFSPWPGAFTLLPGEPARMLKIWDCEPRQGGEGVPGTVLEASKDQLTIACGAGSLALRSVQKEGSRRMSAAEFLAGHKLIPGDRLGGG